MLRTPVRLASIAAALSALTALTGALPAAAYTPSYRRTRAYAGAYHSPSAGASYGSPGPVSSTGAAMRTGSADTGIGWHESNTAKRQFQKKTGYPDGRPGYVVDYIVPLRRGGADSPDNMQWLTIDQARARAGAR